MKKVLFALALCLISAPLVDDNGGVPGSPGNITVADGTSGTMPDGFVAFADDHGGDPGSPGAAVACDYDAVVTRLA